MTAHTDTLAPYPIPRASKQTPNPEVVNLLRGVRQNLVPYTEDWSKVRETQKASMICPLINALEAPGQAKVLLKDHVTRCLSSESLLHMGIVSPAYEEWLGFKMNVGLRKVLDNRQEVYEARIRWIDQMIGDFS